MPIDRSVLVAQQSQFYRHNFRRLLTFAFFLVIVIFGLMGVIAYQHFNSPSIKYFATTSDGRLIEITPIVPH